MKKYYTLLKFAGDDVRTLLSSVFIVALVFGSTTAYSVYAANATLTITLASTLTFNITTDNAGAIALTPGIPKFGTSTLWVQTNSTSGYNVLVAGDYNTGLNTTLRHTNTTTFIPDKNPQWSIDDSATTTTPSDATAITAASEFLAFRVMSASGTDHFQSTSWWGTSDVVYNANQWWAGFGSSTNRKKIGMTHANAYILQGAAAYINTVQYFVNAPVTQLVGTYDAPLTYTASVN